MLSLIAPVSAAYNFVQNGDFSQGLTHWTLAGESKDAAIVCQNGEVSFQGILGATRHSIQQSLELDASGYSSLLFQATVRVDEAKLAGTGLTGLEAPLALYVLYADAAGNEHVKEVSGPTGRFWRGFYYEDPLPPGVRTNGEKVERGQWCDVQVELMNLNPRPKTIHAIGVEGSGWARRAAVLKRLALIAPEEGREFVVNPTLSHMAAGWQTCIDFQPAEYQAELVTLDQGIQLKSTFGDKRAGLIQKLETDISAFHSLILSAEVKVDSQRVSGTGFDGREAPLALFVTYTDVNGVKHDQLAAGDTERRMFWHGLYILKPQLPATDRNGSLTEAGVWRTVSFELMALDPKPRLIHSIGAEGSGRAPRDASIRKLSLKGR